VARACAATGDARSSAEQFALARSLFEACGANLFLDQLVREQRRLSARSPRLRRGAPPSGATAQAGLTSRELEIAQLVATGLTNKQIAEHLFLSPRTVETHLMHLFAKLDVSTRAAVAPALSRLQ
jgi:DNA-binding NarL/FixJ family response regulator